MESPQELDVVRLEAPAVGWPVGTKGTLVDAFSQGGLVEISDAEGRTVDVVSVGYDDMTVIWSAARRQHVADQPSAVTARDE